MTLDWEYLARLAGRVAASIAAAWSVVEEDDVKQQILLYAYENKSVLEDHYDQEPTLWAIFRKVGTRYASAERDARDLLDSQYYYTPNEARDALKAVAERASLGEAIGARENLATCTTSDAPTSAVLDVMRALPGLSTRYQHLLTKRYVLGLPTESPADASATSRALSALAREMNRTLRRHS